MATFQEVITHALKDNKASLMSVNRNLIEISKGTKKKSGFLKIAVTDELAASYMMRDNVGFMLSINGDYLNEINEIIDQNKLKGDVENAS